MATTPEITTAINQVKTAQGLLVQELSSRRARIAEINTEISEAAAQTEALRKAPISLDDLSVYLEAHIHKLGMDWIGSAKDITRKDRLNSHDSHVANTRTWQEFEPVVGEINGGQYFFNENTGPQYRDTRAGFHMLCFFFPVLVHERLMAVYREHSGASFGNTDLPSVAERRATVAANEQLIGQLQEEKTTIEAEIKLMTEGIFADEQG